jgi:hypothetical protein
MTTPDEPAEFEPEAPEPEPAAEPDTTTDTAPEPRTKPPDSHMKWDAAKGVYSTLTLRTPANSDTGNSYAKPKPNETHCGRGSTNATAPT